MSTAATIIGIFLVAVLCLCVVCGFVLSGRQSDEERNRDLHFTYPNSMH